MTSTAAKPVRKPNPLLTAYLVAFNAASGALWAYTFVSILMHFVNGGAVNTLYDAIHKQLFAAQSMAIMEIFHSLFGLVRSPFMSALMQVSSRLLLTWGVTYLAPESRTGYGFLLMSLSWSIVEIPRYAFYTVNLVAEPPYWLKWLRYSLFAVLYPSGISGEILCILAALPTLRDTNMLSIQMPNTYNFAFDYYYFVLCALASYLPGSPFMYSHMVAQRKKALAPKKKAE